MQPVRRGERQQRGRFKEFWQCDVDCIWRSGTDVGHRYACETISTLQSALQSVLQSFSLSKKFTSHISHIGLTKSFLTTLVDNDESLVQRISELLDKYYKREHSLFIEELTTLIGAERTALVETIILHKDYTVLETYNTEAYTALHKTITTLQQL